MIKKKTTFGIYSPNEDGILIRFYEQLLQARVPNNEAWNAWNWPSKNNWSEEAKKEGREVYDYALHIDGSHAVDKEEGGMRFYCSPYDGADSQINLTEENYLETLNEVLSVYAPHLQAVAHA